MTQSTLWTPLQEKLLEELSQTVLLYQTSHSREEIAILAVLFAEALEDEAEWPEISRAFGLHRKRNKRFPTPAHILELLPECRITPEHTVIEQNEKRTPGYGKKLCNLWLRKNRGENVTDELAKLLEQSKWPEVGKQNVRTS